MSNYGLGLNAAIPQASQFANDFFFLFWNFGCGHNFLLPWQIRRGLWTLITTNRKAFGKLPSWRESYSCIKTLRKCLFDFVFIFHRIDESTVEYLEERPEWANVHQIEPDFFIPGNTCIIYTSWEGLMARPTDREGAEPTLIYKPNGVAPIGLAQVSCTEQKVAISLCQRRCIKMVDRVTGTAVDFVGKCDYFA